MRKATFVVLKHRVFSSSILTVSVWNSSRAHEPALISLFLSAENILLSCLLNPVRV